MLSALLGLVLAFGLFTAAPALAQAADDDLLGVGYAGQSGLTNTDVRITVAKIINAGLGILGTIMLVLVIYAGFLWMTAAGKEDQIGTAKGILSAAVVGLVIILTAYSISTFVIKELYKASTGADDYVIVNPPQS